MLVYAITQISDDLKIKSCIHTTVVELTKIFTLVALSYQLIFRNLDQKSPFAVKALLSPRGTYLILDTPEGAY